MNLRCQIPFVERIEQINDYLVREARSQSGELIEDLESKREELYTAKPVVKIVSPSPP